MESFAAIANLLPEAILLVRPDGTILAANQVAAERLRRSSQELGQGNLSELVDDDWQHVRTYLRACSRTRQLLPGALRFRLPDGTLLACRAEGGLLQPAAADQPSQLLLRLVPTQDASRQFLLLNQKLQQLSREIHRRRTVEEDLQRHSGRLRLLKDVAVHLLTARDPDTIFRGVFEQIRGHFGLDQYFAFLIDEPGSGLRLQSFSGIADDAAQMLAQLDVSQTRCWAAAVRRQPHLAFQLQDSQEPAFERGKRMGIRSSASFPLVIEDELVGMLVFASSHRDRLDERDVEFLQTICDYVTVAYERLRLFFRQQDADRRKDEFLATLAHELRNPLSPLSSGLSLIKIAGDDPLILEEALRVMERQLQQLVHLVDDLLDLSRITRNRVELRREQIELATVLQQAVEASRAAIPASGQQLTVMLPSEPLFLHGDRTRLTQVFANLLNNAVKYTPPDGQIWLAAEREGSDAVVRVKDTGIGIPAEMLARIFEMFTQVDRTLERSHGGLGIGLALVRSFVEMHGGTVRASSPGSGQGSEFEVRLPLLLATATQGLASSPASEQLAPSPPKQRILVVDDNRDAARLLAATLERLGHDVRTAHDGLEALEAAESYRPGLVFLDIGMPRMNGYEAARGLRRQAWGKEIVLVALTGWGQDRDRQQSRDAGFDHHLVKPLDHSALVSFLAGLDHNAASA